MVGCDLHDEVGWAPYIEEVPDSGIVEDEKPWPKASAKSQKKKKSRCSDPKTHEKKMSSSSSTTSPNVEKLLDAEFDLNDHSMARWNNLLEKTKEIRSLAYSSPAMLTHAPSSEIMKHLDDLINYMTGLDSPTVDDFKFVDEQMDKIHRAVGEAIDKFLTERRTKRSSFMTRLQLVTKVLTACSVLFGLWSFLTEWSKGSRR